MSDPASSDPLANHWWDAVQRSTLLYQRCADCGLAVFYPRVRCSHCFSGQLAWNESAGDGSIAAFTVVRRAPSAAFAEEVPYVVALVDLDEGFRMMSNIIDTRLGVVSCGQRVEATFRPNTAGRILPYFRPTRSS